jgi:simple sugar transport system ATP-binding protein
MSLPVPLLEMRGIHKHFGTVKANDNIDLRLYPGDILGLLGENGAGKTTLMNVLFGVYHPDDGKIFIDGKPVNIDNSSDALALGVGMVHQHFHVVPRHTVLENLMVGQKGKFGRLPKAAIRQQMDDIGQRYDLSLDPDVRVEDLTIGQQQRLEIIKALIFGAKILILDEPTATLTPHEADGLFAALRAMADKQMGVIFITHKLNEIRTITNRVVIMRHGKVIASRENNAKTSRKQLAELMCGQPINLPERSAKANSGIRSVRLTLKNICTTGRARTHLKDVNLDVHGGEIVGIAGVSGNGQKELADVIAGILKPSSGRLFINEQQMKQISPGAIQAMGVGRIPEDRTGTGLITTLPLSDSMVLSRIDQKKFNRFGFLKHGAIRQFVTQLIKQYDIKADGPGIRTGTLSGGNLQKALLARELAWDPQVLLAAQPTRGLDVSAAQFVHRKFLELRQRDRALVIISEDLEELFQISDRIAVMYEGRIMDILPIEEATVSRIGLLMAGVREDAA